MKCIKKNCFMVLLQTTYYYYLYVILLKSLVYFDLSCNKCCNKQFREKFKLILCMSYLLQTFAYKCCCYSFESLQK